MERRGRNEEFWRGFTLIELLVVITIIAVLAAILFPVFMTARWRAHNTTCVSNLRQLGMQLRMYADDSDDHVPVGNDWYWGDMLHIPNARTPYVNRCLAGRVPSELWHCPADLGFRLWAPGFNRVDYDCAPSLYRRIGQSYDYNVMLIWNPDTSKLDLLHISSVKRPERITLLKDAHHMWHENNHVLNPLARAKTDPGAWNIVFLDGHARSTVNTTGLYGSDRWTFWTVENNPRRK